MIKKTIVALIISLPNLVFGQCPSELNEFITGFENLESSSFDFLDDKLDSVKIIGYGEDTHGSAEFTQLAEELMRYLAENHNFNTLILETGFGEGLYLNDFIHGNRDDIQSILVEHNSTWRYKTEEFIHLMEFLREHNLKSENKISVYGCEMQYVISDVHRIETYLKKVGSDYEIHGFQKHLWENIEESEKSNYTNSYFKLKSYFEEHYKEFIAQTTENEFNLIYHQIEVLGQFITAINQNVYQRKMDFRDIYMSENIEWILNNENPNAKALFWAHNDHIGDWVANGIVDVAGHFLKKRYGSSYYNISTDFGTGDFFAYPHNPDVVGSNMRTFSFDKIDTTTFTYCIQQNGAPNAFVDLRNAKQNDFLSCYLNAPLKIMYGAGSQEWGTQIRTIDIGKAFDAIIYIDNISVIHFMK